MCWSKEHPFAWFVSLMCERGYYDLEIRKALSDLMQRGLRNSALAQLRHKASHIKEKVELSIYIFLSNLSWCFLEDVRNLNREDRSINQVMWDRLDIFKIWAKFILTFLENYRSQHVALHQLAVLLLKPAGSTKMSLPLWKLSVKLKLKSTGRQRRPRRRSANRPRPRSLTKLPKSMLSSLSSVIELLQVPDFNKSV